MPTQRAPTVVRAEKTLLTPARGVVRRCSTRAASGSVPSGSGVELVVTSISYVLCSRNGA